MSQSRIYIKFNSNGKGAKIFVNPKEPIEGALLNPNTSLVRKLPPEHWKLENTKIVPMTKEEQSLAVDNSTKSSLFRRTKHIVHTEYVDRPIKVEVPVEVIKEVKVEVPVEVIKHETHIKEVIREVKVPQFIEKIVQTKVEVPVEVIKEVQVEKIVYQHKKSYLVLAALALLLQLINLARGI
jgi:hypothetical protein